MQITQTVVPSLDNEIVAKFCKTVNPRQDPLRLSVMPEQHCKVNECVENVMEKVKVNGGSSIYGWQIWLWPDVLVEAEFHTVWKSQDSSEMYIDITPKASGCKTTLFIPDDRIKYKGMSIDNIRKNISPNSLVDLLISLNECRYSIINSASTPYESEFRLSQRNADVLHSLESSIAMLTVMLKQGNTKNNRCLCGSERKFKICCGKVISSMVSSIKNTHI